MKAKRVAKKPTPALKDLRPLAELQRELAHVFPSQAALDWELRVNRKAYVVGGALFRIGRRLLVHQPTFERIAAKLAACKMVGSSA